MNKEITFAGFRKIEKPSEAEIIVYGMPLCTPYPGSQANPSLKSPDAVRAASQKYALMTDNYDFDLEGPLLDGKFIRTGDLGNLSTTDDAARNRALLLETTENILKNNGLPILLGGDDSIPIPYFQAFAMLDIVHLVQIDAHMDWRDEVKGERFGYSSTMKRASEMPFIVSITQVGMRGVGSAGEKEIKSAMEYGVGIFTADSVRKNGVERVLDRIPEGGSVLVTLDCDGLDPTVIPAVNAPSPGGLQYHHVTGLIHGIARKAKIVGFDMVELAPDKDINGLSALTAARFVWNVIGSAVRSPFFGI